MKSIKINNVVGKIKSRCLNPLQATGYFRVYALDIEESFKIKYFYLLI